MATRADYGWVRGYRPGRPGYYAGLAHSVNMKYIGRFWWPDYSWTARDY